MKRIGIIGYGNMGSAIAERIKSAYNVIVFDKDMSKLNKISGIKTAEDIQGLAVNSDVIILAVKPQDFDAVLNEIKPYAKDKIIISIAAGIATAYIEKVVGVARIIRAMPNIAAKIGEGITCLSKGKFASEEDFDLAQDLFVFLGETMSIDERLMHAATAISGSGPGYFYALIQNKPETEWEKFARIEFISKLKHEAEKNGFSADQAMTLANATSNGSLALLKKTGLSPQALRSQVTSKGGTTEAGLKVLQGNIKHLTEAVEAAKKRAEELEKKE